MTTISDARIHGRKNLPNDHAEAATLRFELRPRSLLLAAVTAAALVATTGSSALASSPLASSPRRVGIGVAETLRLIHDVASHTGYGFSSPDAITTQGGLIWVVIRPTAL